MTDPISAPFTLGLAPTTQVLIWISILIVAIALGGTALLMYRQRLFAKDSEDQSSILDSLRAMRDQGQISLEEFDIARRRMAAKVAGVAPPPSSTVRRTPDPGVRIAPPGFDLTGAALPPADALGPTPPSPDESAGGGRADKPPGPTNPSS